VSIDKTTATAAAMPMMIIDAVPGRPHTLRKPSIVSAHTCLGKLMGRLSR
jgi:hypothetical protein